MLPTYKEKENKLQELMMLHCSDVMPHANDRKKFAKEYAKWLCIKVIQHCAEVVDKESILTLINEL